MAHGIEVGPDDDGFHALEDRWWSTETCWFSYAHPERKLGGWLYALCRPTIGTVSGGAWVWDDTAHLPWEVLYSTNHAMVRLPDDSDLRDITFATGMRVKAIEPLTVYEVGFSDPGRLEADLRFEALIPPQPFPHGEPPWVQTSHFDQCGRVTGEIILHGERITIDSLAVRDRSWGPRPETRPRRAGYCFGTASRASAFFVTTNPTHVRDEVVHGYFVRDGEISRVVGGSRRVERNPREGWVVSEEISGHDELGRSFTATGFPLSRMVINRHTSITWNSLMQWEVDGLTCWGEDQDIWPVHDWASFKRGAGVASSVSG